MDLEDRLRLMVDIDDDRWGRDTERLEGEIAREYNRSMNKIVREVNKLYDRYADDEGVLNYGEIRRRKAWDKLYKLIKKEGDRLAEAEQRSLRRGLETELKKAYYLRVYQLAKLAVIPNPKWKELTERIIDTVLAFPWSGALFSDRIWDNRDRLVKIIRRELTQSFINGEHSDKVAKVLKKRFQTSTFNARRLARTEMARVNYEAHRRVYRENKVKEVMWIATHDKRTCKICGPRDGRRYEFGNEPPLPAHPQCRCDVAPVPPDTDFNLRRHNQKDETGIKPTKRGEVRAYNSYEEWIEANGIRI